LHFPIALYLIVSFVLSNLEHSWQRILKLFKFIFCSLESFGDLELLLVGRNVQFVFMLGNLFRVELQSGQRVNFLGVVALINAFHFPKTRHDASPLNFDVAILLEQAKFHTKPVDVAKNLYGVVICAQAGQADGLTEVAEVGICEHGCVAQVLMQNVRFGGLNGFTVVADVLGAVEYAQRQPI